MKTKITLLAALATAGLNSVAQAATVFDIGGTSAVAVCAAASNKPVLGGAGSTTSGAPVTETTSFVKVAFAITCGANTHASVQNGYSGPTSFAVASGSVKGNQSFRGGASSGGIVLSAGCPTSCVASDVTTALAAAVSNGS